MLCMSSYVVHDRYDMYVLFAIHVLAYLVYAIMTYDILLHV